MTETTALQQRGKPFQKGQSGNPAGRPVGARHKTTLAIQSLLDGEGEALTRRAIELALAGDMVALRLCLERLAPPRKDAPVALDLPPVATAADIVAAQSAILAAVASGEITPSEGAALAALTDGLRKTIETNDLEQRLTALEANLQSSTKRR